MGERANIRLHFETNDTDGQDIYLYSHWDGGDLALTLQKALARRERWNDDAYLARIIANEVFHKAYGEETGYGLAPYECDNNYNIVHVDLGLKTVTIGEVEWTFEEYVKAPEADIKRWSWGSNGGPSSDAQ